MSQPGEQLGRTDDKPVPVLPLDIPAEESAKAEADVSDAPLDPQLVAWHYEMFNNLIADPDADVRGRLERYLYRRFGNIDCEEIADVAVIAAWLGLDRFRGTGNMLSPDDTRRMMVATVYRIANTKVWQSFRQHSVYGNYSLDEMMLNPDFQPAEARSAIEAAEKRIDHSALLRLLWDNAGLTKEQTEVIIAQFVTGLKAIETADLLGIEPGAVRARAFRAVHTLRRTAKTLGLEPWNTLAHTAESE